MEESPEIEKDYSKVTKRTLTRPKMKHSWPRRFVPEPRLKEVAEALSQGMRVKQVVEHFRKKWGLGRSTIYRYCDRVERMWKATITDDVVAARKMAITDLTVAINQARERHDPVLTARLYDLLARFTQ